MGYLDYVTEGKELDYVTDNWELDYIAEGRENI